MGNKRFTQTGESAQNHSDFIPQITTLLLWIKTTSKGTKWEAPDLYPPIFGHYCQESHGSQQLKTPVKQTHDTNFINLPDLKSKEHNKRSQRSISQICHFSKTSHTNPMTRTSAGIHTNVQRKENSLLPLWVTGLWSQINTWKQLAGPQGESGDTTVWFAPAGVWFDGREQPEKDKWSRQKQRIMRELMLRCFLPKSERLKSS